MAVPYLTISKLFVMIYKFIKVGSKLSSFRSLKNIEFVSLYV